MNKIGIDKATIYYAKSVLQTRKYYHLSHKDKKHVWGYVSISVENIDKVNTKQSHDDYPNKIFDNGIVIWEESWFLFIVFYKYDVRWLRNEIINLWGTAQQHKIRYDVGG